MKEKMMKISKVLIFAAFIMLTISILLAYKTYSAFYSEFNSNISGKLAKWNISVNDSDVTSESTHNYVIEDLNVSQSDNVISGKFAPSLSGTFDIEISPKDTQVSIRYDITIDLTEIPEDSSINLINVEETELSKELIRTDENTYTGTILLNDISENYINNIKLTFEWENDENNNDVDTNVGKVYNNTIEIPVEIKFSQYLGEDIEEYTEVEEETDEAQDAENI